MYIAKDGDLIILARETLEELMQALKMMKYATVEETDIDYQYYNGQFLTPEEVAQCERQRLDGLTLTPADVERALYKAKGMDFEDVKELIKSNQTIDIKALGIELRANLFYRGNSYINTIGNLLGYSSEDLDYLFENKELPEEG